jgi:hypothetical protein
MLVFYFSILIFVNLKVYLRCDLIDDPNELLSSMLDAESYPKKQGNVEYQRKSSKTTISIKSLNTTKSSNVNSVTKKISSFKRIFILKSFKNNNVTVVSKIFVILYICFKLFQVGMIPGHYPAIKKVL